ncbi:hypothetical protein PPACK8108_LOCUS13559, partial [Phakopsora pachyrhizi]
MLPSYCSLSSLHYSLLLCPAFFFFKKKNPYSLYPVSSALLSCYPCAVLILFQSFKSFLILSL